MADIRSMLGRMSPHQISTIHKEYVKNERDYPTPPKHVETEMDKHFKGLSPRIKFSFGGGTSKNKDENFHTASARLIQRLESLELLTEK